MTDHDRGAYSPQTDAPLAFDARQARGGGRGFPTTLVISLVILVVLVVAVVLFYRSGVREAGQGPTTVGAPVAQIKAPPPQGAQSTDPATGLQIYKTESAAASDAVSAPTFTAPPEEPQARPTAPVTAQPLPAPAPAVVAASGATTPVRPAPVQAVPAQPAPAQATAKPPAGAKDPIGALLDKKPATAKPAVVAQAAPPPQPVAAKPASPTVKPAAVASNGAASVQIGAYSSQALAEKGWDDLAKGFGSDMAGKGKHFEPVAKGDSTLYRAAVTGFASHDAAVAFCAKLKTAGHACIVK